MMPPRAGAIDLGIILGSVPTPTTTLGLPFLLSSADRPGSFKQPRGERPAGPLMPQLESPGSRGQVRTPGSWAPA